MGTQKSEEEWIQENLDRLSDILIEEVKEVRDGKVKLRKVDYEEKPGKQAWIWNSPQIARVGKYEVSCWRHIAVARNKVEDWMSFLVIAPFRKKGGNATMSADIANGEVQGYSFTITQTPEHNGYAIEFDAKGKPVCIVPPPCYGSTFSP